MKLEDYIRENNAKVVSSIDELWKEINYKFNQFVIKSKSDPSAVEKYNFVVKDIFVLIGSYVHTSITTKHLNELYISDESLNTILTQVDVTKMPDLAPVYTYASYGKNESKVDFNNPNQIKRYTKYVFGLYVIMSLNDGEASGQLIADFAEEINDNISPDERVFNILKDKPFLIGFVGVRNRYIPIVADDESVLENLGIKTYTISLNGSIKDTLVTEVDVRNLMNKSKEIQMPIIFFKDKVFYAFRNVPKELLEIISSPVIKIGKYKFENNTHIGVIIIRNISEYVKNNTLKDYTPLSSCITYDMAEDFKEDISVLVNSPPIYQSDLSKAGLSNETLNIYLRLSGILLSNRYAINKDILTATYAILKNGINAFINETDQIIVKQDLEEILSLISFYYESIEEARQRGEMSVLQIEKINDELKKLVINRVKIKQGEYKNRIKSMYKISDQDAQNIIDNMVGRGFIEEIDDDETYVLSDDVIKHILNM